MSDNDNVEVVTNPDSEEDVTNTTFQTKIYHESESNQVMGAEIYLFNPKGEKISNILITDEDEFNHYINVLKNMEEAYVPYTEKDLENLNLLQKVADGEIEATDERITTMTWSKLHDLGSLEAVLRNDIDDTTNDYPVIINATKLNGFDSSDFSKKGHTHEDDYLKEGHSLVTAKENQLGHVIIINNLDSNVYNDGECLSAKQGYELNQRLTTVEEREGWSKVISKTNLKYRVNKDLRLVVCNYNQSNYKKLNKETGSHVLHNKGYIKEEYAPSARVVQPLYRGDVTLIFETDGSIKIYNLTKLDSINIHVQIMWKY